MQPKPGDVIPVRVTPRSGQEAVEGWVEDASGDKWLKVRVTVAPEDGKANKAMLRLLAKEWNMAVSSLSIISGETNRNKRVKVK